MDSSVASGAHVVLRNLGPFEIRVRKRSQSLSAIVYELTVQEPGKLLELVDRGPSQGVIGL